VASVHEEASTVSVYHVTAVASRGVLGDRDFASRTLEATVTDAP
jgi:hypothetical protein